MITFAKYPIRKEIGNDFQISVNGLTAETVQTRVSAMPFNRYWPGKQRPVDQTEIASYLSIFTDGEPLKFSVTPTFTFNEVVIRPHSKGVVPEIIKNEIQFIVKGYGYYTVELDGVHHVLHLFVEPNRHFKVSNNGDKTVLYFGPGVHEMGHKELHSDTEVYIHRDAVVYGSFYAVNAKNIKIFGEGVLDGSLYERKTKNFLLAYDYTRAPDASWEKQQMNDLMKDGLDVFTDVSTYIKGSGTFLYRDKEQFDKVLEVLDPVQTGLSFYASENIQVTGIIFRNCAGLSITQSACKKVHYNGIKIIGNWRYNSDGIDFYNCQNCLVKNSFLRTFDDTICVKGQIGWDTLPSCDILVENCVLWNDWGHTLDIGVDTVAPEIYNITVRDCDCIHTAMTTMNIGNQDRPHIHDILFENIRVEYSSYDVAPIIQESDDDTFNTQHAIPRLIDVFLGCGIWSIDGLYGKISNVTFKNIFVFGDNRSFPSKVYLRGNNAEHNISNVVFENIVCNGKKILDVSELDFHANEFVDFKIL